MYDKILGAHPLARFAPEEIHACVGRLMEGGLVEYAHGGWLKVLVNQLKLDLDEAKPPSTGGHTVNVLHSNIVASNFAQGSNHVRQQATGSMTVEQVTEALKLWLPEASKRIEADVGDASDKSVLKGALETITEEMERPKTRLEMLGGALRTFTNAAGRVAGKVGTEVATKLAVAKLTHELSPWMNSVEEAVRGQGG